MKLKLCLFISSISIILTMACSARFVKKDLLVKLEKSYSYDYTIKKAVDIGNNQTSRIGDKVKLYFKSTAQAIKVYAYPFKKSREEALGNNILYLFEEAFPKKKWDEKFFKKKLLEVVEPSPSK